MKLLRTLGFAFAFMHCPVVSISAAHGFDFFGLFGAPDTAAPAEQVVAYEVAFSGLDDSKLEQNLKDASVTWRLRLDAPSSGLGLARRVAADYPRIADALWASGYYNAAVEADVAGVAIEPDGDRADAAAAAERHRGASLAPVRFRIIPGPLFRLRHVVVYDARTNAPIDGALAPRAAFEPGPDSPARAASLRALQAEWIDALRAQSYPLAKIVKAAPVVLHEQRAMDVALTIDPGPRAGIGAVRVAGSPGVDPAVIRSFIYLHEGEDYSPRKLADTRKAIARIEAVGGVRIEEGTQLDSAGNLPITIETSPRKVHAIGASALFSNVDGPALRAYWMDRNLFGGAERLRLDLEGGLAPFGSGAKFRSLSSLKWTDVIGRTGASFVKPALWGSRNDLLVDVVGARERTDYYSAAYGSASAAVRHRFSDEASVQAGVEVERGRTHDVWGWHNYALLGFPLAATYDSTDSSLAPTRGVRANARVTPYVKALPDGVGMVQSKAQVSGYYALDEDAQYIAAARIAAGSIVGADIATIPASHRFFAGGGGSVRGYRYRSLSPQNGFGFPTGGRSLLEGSAELRVKITQSIGIVPFVDAGAAFASPWPDFRASMRFAAGVGLRYYTAIGPIRVDVATPVSRRPGESRMAFFVGIGEAF